MNDGLQLSDAPAATNTRIASGSDRGSHNDDAPGQEERETRSLVSRVRGAANVLTLLGAIAFALGWAMHWPEWILGRVALATLTTFIVSFVAILIENARESSHAHDEDDDT